MMYKKVDNSLYLLGYIRVGYKNYKYFITKFDPSSKTIKWNK